MRLFDAHNHLDPDSSTKNTSSEESPLYCVTNSTNECNWEVLLSTARKQERIIPAFGIHPWFVNTVSFRWYETLLKYLKDDIPAVIGEIGLDRARNPESIEQQELVFREQLVIAQTERVPAVIHCVKAFGLLTKLIEEHPLKESGFMMHSYGGSAEIARQLVKSGAYFTLSNRMIRTGGEKIRELLTVIPCERLLIETDLPICTETLLPAEPILTENYRRMAAILKIDVEELALQLEKNFISLFGRFVRPQNA